MDQPDRQFIAYEVAATDDMPITPAPIDREWMDASDKRYAYRCLPLTIANQAGWLIANPVDFTATWDGGPWLHNLRIELDFPNGSERLPQLGFTIIADAAHTHSGVNPTRRRDPRVASHFGSGVVTFTIPYLFRTPPSVNLWVKGPANWIKDGAQALEGIVETDWSTATFTMNWKLTRPHHPVHFARGEPICMIVPVRRGLVESLEPCRVPISSQPDLEEQVPAMEPVAVPVQRGLARKRACGAALGMAARLREGRDAGRCDGAGTPNPPGAEGLRAADWRTRE